MLLQSFLSGDAITEQSRNIPEFLMSFFTFCTAASTAATSPVIYKYDLPHIPFAIRSSISCTIEVFAAMSAATIIDAGE